MKFKHFFAISCVVALTACQNDSAEENAEPVAGAAVLDTYVRIARAAYGDSLTTARNLDIAIDQLLAEPSQSSLEMARQAWKEARVPYMQTEAFRFGNPVVDEWEVRVNAWPLDEGLIDYTQGAYGTQSDNNLFYSANVIANTELNIGGIAIDASQITPQLLRADLHMIDGVEANVATGYHAIEFLLWGQDLNGTNPGAGNRPYTDYSVNECTNDNCERRRNYLKSASILLISDLQSIVSSWEDGGPAYVDLMGKGEQGGLATILTGLGSLAYGELAGERTRLALLLNDPEEEHDCFSDNTHYSHYYDARGIRNVYLGEYTRVDGTVVEGPSIADMTAGIDATVAAGMQSLLEDLESAMMSLVEAGNAGQTFDVLISADNEDGEAIVNAVIDALVALTGGIEDVIAALELENISIEGSDSLDNPALVL